MHLVFQHGLPYTIPQSESSFSQRCVRIVAPLGKPRPPAKVRSHMPQVLTKAATFVPSSQTERSKRSKILLASLPPTPATLQFRHERLNIAAQNILRHFKIYKADSQGCATNPAYSILFGLFLTYKTALDLKGSVQLIFLFRVVTCHGHNTNIRRFFVLGYLP